MQRAERLVLTMPGLPGRRAALGGSLGRPSGTLSPCGPWPDRRRHVPDRRAPDVLDLAPPALVSSPGGRSRSPLVASSPRKCSPDRRADARRHRGAVGDVRSRNARAARAEGPPSWTTTCSFGGSWVWIRTTRLGTPAHSARTGSGSSASTQAGCVTKSTRSGTCRFSNRDQGKISVSEQIALNLSSTLLVAAQRPGRRVAGGERSPPRPPATRTCSPRSTGPRPSGCRCAT